MRSRIALEKIPIEQRFSADDRELVTLAEILVRSGIAAVEDWERSGRDAAKYLSLTLERWVREHGGDRLTDDLTSISVSATDSLTTQMSVGQKGRSTLDGRSGQCRLCASWRGHRVARKDPSSLAIHLLRVLCAVAQPMGAGVRLSDAEERVEMLREWYEGEEYAEQYEMPDVGGARQHVFKNPH